MHTYFTASLHKKGTGYITTVLEIQLQEFNTEHTKMAAT